MKRSITSKKERGMVTIKMPGEKPLLGFIQELELPGSRHPFRKRHRRSKQEYKKLKR
jgi:hypothetical protein